MAATTAYTVSVLDLNYGVKPFLSQPRSILNNISAKFEPGLNGLLGPSGSGKTTLLDLLSCHKSYHKKYFSGRILLNGADVDRNSFRAIAAYVPQEDNLSAFLTVRENLQFSANIRMVGKSPEQRTAEVTRMIELLGLNKCADTLVGNYLVRGVSSGEKKRTCIAMELLLQPDILLLDEPTTGLDSFSANEIVNCLCRVARDLNKTVIMSLHQPRYSIFKQLDTLFLLNVNGECAYHGPTSKARDYFAERGFTCEDADNPGDFLLDLVQSRGLKSFKNDALDITDVSFSQKDDEKLHSNGITGNSITADNSHNSDYGATHIEMNGGFHDSKSLDTVDFGKMFLSSKELSAIREDIVESLTDSPIWAEKQMSGFLTQMKHLLLRELRTVLKNPECFIGQVVIATFLSLLFGLLFFQSELTPERGFQNRHGLFFFLSLSLMMMNIAHIELFIAQQKLFFHEYANGYYYLLPYFLSTVLFDLLTLRVIPCLIFGFTLTYMVGLQSDADHLLYMIVMLILLAVTGCGISYLITSLLRTFYISHMTVILVFVVMMVFAGLIINLKTLPGWVEGLKYLSVVYYGVSGLSVNEFVGLNFCGNSTANSACPGLEAALADPANLRSALGPAASFVTPETIERMFSNPVQICVSGESGLEVQGIDYQSVSKWFYSGMVSLIALIMYTLTFVRLYFSNRHI